MFLGPWPGFFLAVHACSWLCSGGVKALCYIQDPSCPSEVLPILALPEVE